MFTGNKFLLALGHGASVFHCVVIAGAESRPVPVIYFLLSEGAARGGPQRGFFVQSRKLHARTSETNMNFVFSTNKMYE